MRRILATLALGTVGFGTIGCASSPCSTGWGAWVGKPPTVSAQTVLGPTMTNFAGQGIAAGPIAVQGVAAPPLALQAQGEALPMPSVARPSVGAGVTSSCTLDDVCRMLASMRFQLDKLTVSKPMPGGD